MGVASGPRSTPSSCVTCLICGDEAEKRFSRPLYGEEVKYFQCRRCGHLTAQEDESTRIHGQGSYFHTIDSRWKDRQASVLHSITRLTQLPGIRLARICRILDYECGSADLVRELNRIGFDAFGYEPSPVSSHVSARVFSDFTALTRKIFRFDLATMIGVLEHIRQPDEVLDRVTSRLHSQGYLLLYAETFQEGRHNKDWYYLNPAAGHISIYSEKSLQMLMTRHDFFPILRINGCIWLFRHLPKRERSFLEWSYFMASQARTRLNLRVKSTRGEE